MSKPKNGGRKFPALQSGSLLRLTGIPVPSRGEGHEPASFRILLRQPGDIELLETPPWWTSRHTFMLVGGMILVIVFALAWVALLRRQVRRQTKLIRQKLEDEAALEERYSNLFENANDMVYTHDLEGRTSLPSTKPVNAFCNRKRDQILQRQRSHWTWLFPKSRPQPNNGWNKCSKAPRPAPPSGILSPARASA